jgi:hypothetical protein
MREPYSQAVDTVARLQEAARNHLPVLIPGARESAAPADANAVIADPDTAHARAAGVFNRIRSEREPDTRPGRTLLARLWRRLFRGPEAAAAAMVK